LNELVGYFGTATDDALDPLRILVSLEAGLGQRIHGDDLGTVLFGLLQSSQHPGVVGARILAHHDDEVGLAEVVVGDGGLADADGLSHRPSGRFVAHVRAVGQVVGAEGPHEQLVRERGLVRGPAAGVERCLVRRIERLQLVGDDSERIRPADRSVVVVTRDLVDGFDEPPLHAQPILAAALQVAHRVLGPEVPADGDGSGLPGDRLRAVLTELEGLAVGGVRPGAAHAVEAVLLVHGQQGFAGAVDAHALKGWDRGVQYPWHSRRPVLGGTDLEYRVSGELCVVQVHRTRLVGCRLAGGLLG
jgi:hypothetical protein